MGNFWYGKLKAEEKHFIVCNSVNDMRIWGSPAMSFLCEPVGRSNAVGFFPEDYELLLQLFRLTAIPWNAAHCYIYFTFSLSHEACFGDVRGFIIGVMWKPAVATLHIIRLKGSRYDGLILFHTAADVFGSWSGLENSAESDRGAPEPCQGHWTVLVQLFVSPIASSAEENL